MAEGGELLEFVKTLGDLEWAKFQARRPVISLGHGEVVDDRSVQPPYTSFRFISEDASLTQRLRDVISSYSGDIQWEMFGRERSPLPGTNWTVGPRLVNELREEAAESGTPIWQLCEQRMPGFGPIAYRDLLGLVEHVKASW